MQANRPNQRFIKTPHLRQRWSVSHMFIEDHLRNDPDFPKPIFFGRHRH
jgi:predicted DNA-binding transcriptional regulator AlpA